MTPTELVNAILKAPVDLVYNGGIGTYIKATSEDATRRSATARTTRCASTAANCAARCSPRAVTWAARNWAASNSRNAGGRIYTDAIDNSAGVDTSDHEVNIKILLGLADRRRRADGKAAQHAAGRDDRRRRGAGAARQLFPDAGVVRDRPHRTARCWMRRRASCSSWRSRPASLNRWHRVPAVRTTKSQQRRKRRRAASPAPKAAVLLAYSKIWLVRGDCKWRRRCPTIRGWPPRCCATSRVRADKKSMRSYDGDGIR